MNKRCLSTVGVFFTMLFLLCVTEVTAQSNLYYRITSTTDFTVEVAEGDLKGNYSGDVVIPERITYRGDTYRVTSIGSRAFEICTGLTSIEIPNSVESIGDYAFEGCI